MEQWCLLFIAVKDVFRYESPLHVKLFLLQVTYAVSWQTLECTEPTYNACNNIGLVLFTPVSNGTYKLSEQYGNTENSHVQTVYATQG